jgi:diguanylate cyclase (GGDEF)-like protein/PAS domain S-box-containing protein
MSGPLLPRLIGVVLLSLSAAVMSAWLARAPALLQALPGYPIVFNAALCFALAAVALILEGFTHPFRRNAQSALGAATIVIAGASLVQYVFPIDVGIDSPGVHLWLSGRIAHPGRMAMMTCVAFLLTGAVLILRHRVTTGARAHAVCGLTLAIGAIGVLSIAGHILGLQQVFHGYLFSRVSLLTAAAFILLSIGLWTAWRKEPWNELRAVKSDISRIMLASGATTIAIAAVCSLAGFIVMQRGAEKSLGDDLARILDARIAAVTQIIDQRLNDAGRLALTPLVADDLAALAVPSAEPRSRRLLQAFADEALTFGFSAVAIADANGNEIARSGRQVTQAELSLRLQRPASATLLWSGQFLLHSETIVTGYGRALGKVIAQQPLPEIGELIKRAQDGGQTDELVLCAHGGKDIDCAPSRLRRQPFQLPRMRQDSKPTTIGLALDGARGVHKLIDREGNEAIAAYAPVGNLGLGMVLRQNTVELYAPIREQLLQLVPLIAILIVAGIAVMHSLIVPLARELALSEERLRTITDNMPVLIAYIDRDLRYQFANALYEQWFGVPREQIIGRTVEEAFGRDFYVKRRKHLNKCFDGHTVKVEIDVGDGAALRVVLSEFIPHVRDGVVLGAYVLSTDVTAARQYETRLKALANTDPLTGLFNRRGHEIELAAAIHRARRAHGAMALMYLDIDHFKQVNDTLGHAAGDQMLKAFAGRLSATVRASDIVCRLAGDEFTVILEGVRSPAECGAIAATIVAAMQSPFTVGHELLLVTTSIGVAWAQGEDAVAELMAEAADSALYAAKAAGRNQFHVAGTD